MLRAAIFDMDGVIVDSHPTHKRAWRRLLQSQGRETSETDLNFVLDGRKREEILSHFLGDLSDEQIRLLGCQKEKLFKEEAADMKLIEGVSDFLQRLTEDEIKLAVASSGSGSRVNDILTSFQLCGYFGAVVTGDQVAVGKPDPAIFRVACNRLSIEPAETIVFEDSVSGVKAAKTAGMQCLGIATNVADGVLSDAGADCVVPNFTAVTLEAIQELFC